jgi:outer membrane protein assembly factor BamA
VTTAVVAAWLAASFLGRPEGRPLHGAGQASAPAETIAVIQVHGNQVTADEEIVRLAGVAVGDLFLDSTVEEVTTRLRKAGRFDQVHVLKRFASLEDPSRITLVIVVNEGPVRIEVPDDPDLPIRVVKRRGLTNVMVMPVLDAEDGYGVTFGARLAYVGVTGRRGRVSVPLTWGGVKRVAVEFDRPFESGPLTRVQAGTGIQRIHNPGFDADDTRRRAWARAERAVGRLRVGGQAEWQRVSFTGSDDDVWAGGVDATFDTRRDPQARRNAVLASASWTRLSFRSGDDVNRTRLEGNGYLGLVGQTVIVARGLREGASGTLPPPFQSLLGGSANLRGFRAGTAAGDTLVAGSLDLRIPLTSPLDLGRLGVNAFVDTGTVYAHDERLKDQALRTGAGAGVWMTATAFHLGLAVARGSGAGTRVHFSAGIAY